MDEIELVKRTAEEWNTLRDNVSIYELSLPDASQIANIVGDSEKWEKKKKDTGDRYYYGICKERLYLKQVTSCWSNPKGTVKAILVGDGYSSIFSRDGRVVGYPGMSVERYGGKGQDVFHNIDIGTWFICPENYHNDEKTFEVAFIINGTKDEAIEALELLYIMDKQKTELNKYKWKDEQYHTKSDGTIYIEDVRRQKITFDRAIRRFRWGERKDRWDLLNAVKGRLKTKEENGRFKVEIDALDDNHYSLDCLPKSQVSEAFSDSGYGANYSSLYTIDYWLDFVYFKPDQWHSHLAAKDELTRRYFGSLIGVRGRISGDMVFGFNKKTVSLEKKTMKNGGTLNYVNGKVMKDETIYGKIVEYFTQGKPLYQKKIATSGTSTKTYTISAEAQKLLDEGLNGDMEDLEGRLPFHLNLVLKNRQWYIECAGKLFHVKGGHSALSKIQTAIKGTAIIDHQKYSWKEGGRSGTRVIKDRLAELVGEKNALWIVLNTKKMGALTKVMVGETN